MPVKKIAKWSAGIIGGLFVALLILGTVLTATGWESPEAKAEEKAEAAAKVHAANQATWDEIREKANAELAAGVAKVEAQKAADAEAARVAAEAEAARVAAEQAAAAQKAADDEAARVAAEAAKPTPAPKQPTTAPKAPTTTAPKAPVSSAKDYGTCKAAKAAGQGPYYKGQPEYNYYDDRDGDGVVCE